MPFRELSAGVRQQHRLATDLSVLTEKSYYMEQPDAGVPVIE